MTNIIRYTRQQNVFKFGCKVFGREQMFSPEYRAIRLLEEAIELYQATGASPDTAHKLVDYVFSRPKGEVFKELGGVGVCVLVLAHCMGIDADEAEKTEANRLFDKGVEFFKKRNEEKDAAGFVPKND